MATITPGGGGNFGGGGASGSFESNNNAFKNTAQPSTQSATTKVKKEKVVTTLNFLPNMLDKFDQYTYHFKLFIVSTENSTKGDVLNTANQYIIAESGVTDLTIDKVDIMSIATPTTEVGTGTGISVKFEIIEPSGAGLIDKLFYQALALGIENWSRMPMYLHLEFRGRDPETSKSYERAGNDELTTMMWVWPITVTAVKAHVTHVGTRYEFETQIQDCLAHADGAAVIQQSVVLEELDTFGKAMTQLEEKLNADAYSKLLGNYSVPDQYKIVVDPELVNLSLLSADQATSTAWGGDYTNLGKKTATYPSSTALDVIVNSLLCSVPDLQTAIKQSGTPDGKPLAANAATNQMKKFWRIIPETIPLTFDYARADFARQYTYFIVSYNLGSLYASVAQAGETPSTKNASVRTVDEYITNKIMNKLYNYIFTGLNDQIYNFDITLNQSFQSTWARLDGMYSDSETKMAGITVDKKKLINDTTKKITENVKKTLQLINSAKPNADIESARNAAYAEITANLDNLDNATATKLIRVLYYAKKQDRLAYTTGIVTNNDNAARRNASMLAQPVSVYDSNGNPFNTTTFISDVDLTSVDSINKRTAMMTETTARLHPVSFVEAQNESATAVGIDSQANAGRTQTSNMFSTAMNAGLGADLVELKLTVKGDPYWLMPKYINSQQPTLERRSNMAPAAAIADIKHIGDPRVANTDVSDNFIVVRFRTPKVADDSTGIAQSFTGDDALAEVETFSGVYKVISVDSKFEMGKFSQVLSCQLDTKIDIKLLMADISTYLKGLDNVIQQDPAAALAASLIPDTAIKIEDILNLEINKAWLNQLGADQYPFNPTESEV